MGLAETAQLAVRISLDDDLSRGIAGVQRKLNSLNTGLGRTGKGIGQVGAGIAKAGVAIGAFAVTGIGAAAKVGADFEAQLRTINTIAKESDEGLARIGDGIRELARQGRGDLADLSEGYYDVLSAGIAAADAQGVLEASTRLAIGGLSTNAEAVDLITTALNAYGKEATEAARDADVFAKAIEIGKVTADEIAGSFANVAPVAAQMGIEIEEVAAAYGALTAQGVPAAEVATQMQRAIVELLDPSKQLLDLQERLGVSFLEIAKNDGLVVALQRMRDAVGDDDEAFKALFGRIEGYKFALQTTGPQQDAYNSALLAMGDAAGTAAAQMGERQQGLSYQVDRLKANLIDAGLELSSGFLPALTRSVDELSTSLGDPSNRKSIKAIGEDIGRAIDGIDWQEVISGARDFVGVMKGALSVTKAIFDVFNQLPSEVKAAAVGFLAVNKLSGGLVGAGVGNIVGGVGETIARSAGSRLPGPVGKLFAQPVFVTNWPVGMGAAGVAGAAGRGGFIGGAAGLLKTLTVAAIAAPIVEELIDVKNQQRESNLALGEQVVSATREFAGGATLAQLQTKLAGVDSQIAQFRTGFAGDLAYQLNIDGVRDSLDATRGALQSKINELALVEQRQGERLGGAIDGVRQETAFAKAEAITTRIQGAVQHALEFGAQIRAAQGTENTKSAVDRTRGAVDSGASRIVGAIQRNRPIVNVAVSSATVVRQANGTNVYTNTASRVRGLVPS